MDNDLWRLAAVRPARMRSPWAKMLPWAYTERRQPTRAADNESAMDDFLYDLGPTVGYCSKCGDARQDFYTCRNGGHTVAKDSSC